MDLIFPELNHDKNGTYYYIIYYLNLAGACIAVI